MSKELEHKSNMIHTVKWRIVNTIETDYFPVTANRADNKARNVFAVSVFSYTVGVIRYDLIHIPDDNTFTFLEGRNPGTHGFRRDIA